MTVWDTPTRQQCLRSSSTILHVHVIVHVHVHCTCISIHVHYTWIQKHAHTMYTLNTLTSMYRHSRKNLCLFVAISACSDVSSTTRAAPVRLPPELISMTIPPLYTTQPHTYIVQCTHTHTCHSVEHTTCMYVNVYIVHYIVHAVYSMTINFCESRKSNFSRKGFRKCANTYAKLFTKNTFMV